MSEIQLMQGDCLEKMKAIPDKSIDMILCDLPYGTTSKNKWDSVIPFANLWEAYNRIIKDNGAILLFGQPPFSSELIISNKKMFRYEWVWQKTLPQGFLNANRMPLRISENIAVFYKKLPTYNPQKWQGKPYNKGLRGGNLTTNYGDFGESLPVNETGMRFPINVIKFSNANHQNIFHPTQKPVPLLEYFIRTYTNEGETVLDNAAGSMSTVIACINTNRNCIAIEKDEHYFSVGCKRVHDHIAKKRIDKADEDTRKRDE